MTAHPYRLRIPSTPPPAVIVTPRQADVLDGMCEGLTFREIARRLYVTEDSAKTYARRLYRRLDARNGTHAVAMVLSGQVALYVAGERRAA